VDGQLIPSTVSIGVAEAKAQDTSFEEILRRADRLMYKAKEAGRNKVVAE
jgi:diguanylate cyclase (GGDEF)-like protein